MPLTPEALPKKVFVTRPIRPPAIVERVEPGKDPLVPEPVEDDPAPIGYEVVLVVADNTGTRARCLNPKNVWPGQICGGRWSPMELERTTAHRVVEYFLASPENRLGLVTYNTVPDNDADLVLPPDQYPIPEVQEQIDQALVNSGGFTYLLEALEKAGESLRQEESGAAGAPTDRAATVQKDIIMVVNPSSPSGPPEVFQQLYDLAEELGNDGIRVHVFVAAELSTFDNDQWLLDFYTAWLRMVAHKSGGTFTWAQDVTPDYLESVFPLSVPNPPSPGPESGPESTMVPFSVFGRRQHKLLI